MTLRGKCAAIWPCFAAGNGQGESKSTKKSALIWPLAAFWGLHDAFGSIISELGATQAAYRVRK